MTCFTQTIFYSVMQTFHVKLLGFHKTMNTVKLFSLETSLIHNISKIKLFVFMAQQALQYVNEVTAMLLVHTALKTYLCSNCQNALTTP